MAATDAMPGLRELVLAGRFFSAGSPAREVATFLTEPDHRSILLGWMGQPLSLIHI